MGEYSYVALVAILLICCTSVARSDRSDHRYKANDPVHFYANKLGPFRNPIETYPYYSLPFCSPAHVKEKKSFGEALDGDRLVTAPFNLEFLKNKESEIICKNKLSREEVSKFRSAIQQDYYLQMFYDDLPIWAFIGKIDKFNDHNAHHYHLFTKIMFEIYYNKDRIIDINVRTYPSPYVDVTEDKEVDVEFSYSVKWKETNALFESRMDKYMQSSTLPHHLEIHWFAVMNSCVTVLILVACLVIFYFRVLKKDFNKFADDVELLENQEETGWKNIHGDVFRYPNHKSLFAAVIGSGAQFLILMLCIIMLGVLGVFRPYSRGNLLVGLVVVYSITFFIAGFVAVYLYIQLEGTNWVRNILITGSVFCGPLFIIFCILNTIAATYRANATLSIGTIFILLCIYFFGALPLLIFGGITGKNTSSGFDAPCHTTKVPREIPTQPWHRGIFSQMAIAGILPFGVIYTELYYIFASVWGHRIYTIYLILLIVAVILVLVTAFVTVTLTYFQLAAENHKWWWRSFLYGGSTGLYVFVYSIYYYSARSDMSGLLQVSFFFGYMACTSYGLFLMLGAVGFCSSFLFVRHIYGSIKCE